MVTSDLSFSQHSVGITEKLLRTIVVIDDQAYFATQSQTPALKDSKSETPPKTMGRGISVLPFVANNESHTFDAQQVTNSFAERGIVCSVIKPSMETDLTNIIRNVASSADVIIIDWDLNDDKGKKAINILAHLIQSNLSALRLFAIYTGDPNVANITKKIRVGLAKLLKRLKLSFDDNSEIFTLILESTRIVVFAKEHTKIPNDYKDRIVPFENLSERIIEEFALMTSGLVSNVAMSSLALIRDNTYKILKKFSSRLDAPYLNHRTLQKAPEDAEDLLTTLIAEEIKAVLEEKSVGSQAGSKPIERWIRSLGVENFTLKQGCIVPLPEVIQLAKSGLQEWTYNPNNQPTRSKYHEFLTKMFTPPNLKNPEFLDEEFALLTTMRSFYEDTVRYLTLGTIFRELPKKKSELEDTTFRYKYFLCLQPVCDTVRLQSSRAFPFIPLIPNEREGNIVIKGKQGKEGKFVFLRTKTNPYHLHLINFTPQGNQDCIVSSKVGADYIFIDDKRTKYEWVGELRSEHAIRMLQTFTGTMARVGVNQSEWLHLIGGKS